MIYRDIEGRTVYYNVVTKRGEIRHVIQGKNCIIFGRDRQKLKSRTFAQEHQARAYLRNHGFVAVG